MPAIYSGVSVDRRIGRFNALRAAALAAPMGIRLRGLDVANYWAGAVRYVRPGGTSTGPGGGLSNTDGGAWSLAEFLAQQGTLSPYTRVVFEGRFFGANAVVTADQIALDLREAEITHGAVVTGWVDTGVNGEFKVSGAAVANQTYLTISEDARRMEGLSATSTGSGLGRLALVSVDTSNDWVRLGAGYTLVDGDKITLVTGVVAGLTIGTLYYVVDAQAPNGAEQDVGLSLTPGGAKIDLTDAGTGNRFFFSDFSGRKGIPVAGALQPGQFAYVPWEDAIYIKPTSGTPDAHEYIVSQTPSNLPCVDIRGDGTIAVGGLIHTNSRIVAWVSGAAVGSGFIGSTVLGGTDALACDNVDGFIAYLVECGDCANHGIGSYNVASGEPNQQIIWCYVHDFGRHVMDWGDYQGLVTNPLSSGSRWHWNIVSKGGRPVATADIPVGLSANTGAIVIDSSSNMDIGYNFVHAVYGEQVEIGPNDYQACLGNRVHHNIFDMRDLLYSEGTPPRVIHLLVNGTYGADETNVAHNNLILLGESFGQSLTGAQDSGVVHIRSAIAAGPPRALTFEDNLIVGEPQGHFPALYLLRKTSAGYPHGTIVGDRNRYVGSGGLHTAVVLDSTGTGTTWDDPINAVTHDLASWRALSGQDAATEEIDAADVTQDGKLRLEAGLLSGADRGLRRDVLGILSRRHIGAFGAGRLVLMT